MRIMTPEEILTGMDQDTTNKDLESRILAIAEKMFAEKMKTIDTSPRKIVRYSELKPRYGISANNIYKRKNFPKQIPAEYGKGYWQDEIETWLKNRNNFSSKFDPDVIQKVEPKKGRNISITFNHILDILKTCLILEVTVIILF